MIILPYIKIVSFMETITIQTVNWEWQVLFKYLINLKET